MLRNHLTLAILTLLGACSADTAQEASARLRSGEAIECSAGDAVRTSDTCELNERCYPLTDGRWCAGPRIECRDGHTEVGEGDTCLQDDAVCYTLEDGRRCTGEDAPECPPGLMGVASASDCLLDDALCFRFSESLWCTGEASSLELGCRDGEARVGSAGECLVDDAVCYALGDGTWCTGPDEASGCPDGLREVASVEDCLADGVCFPLEDGRWCTGA